MPHVAHRGKLGVGVLGAAYVVRPVVNRGDAGGDRIDGRETGRAIVILRLHQRTETRRHREVAERRNIGADEQAERRGPHVHVRIDETRDADHPGAVDHLRRRRVDPLGDGDDGAVADMHVAAGKVGHGGIHGEHGGATDDELAARRQRRARRGGIAHRLRGERARRERCCRQRRGALQKPAPVQCQVCHACPPDMQRSER